MPNDAMCVFWMTESPLHAGAGATLSAIDLPIQRETHTGIPIVYGSGLKGGLREQKADANGDLPPEYEAIFGPKSSQASEHAGLAVFSEARVILLPVASCQGLFIWVTCPAELYRFKRDLAAMERIIGTGTEAAKEYQTLTIPFVGTSGAAAPEGCPAAISDQIFIDESGALSADPRLRDAAAKIAGWFADHALPPGSEYEYWRTRARKSIVVVSDTEFGYLTSAATHIEMHVKIGAAGTVEEGPWSEESLPPDTLLYSSIVLPRPLDDLVIRKLNGKQPKTLVEKLLADHPRFQICGDQSVGKGWVCPRIMS